ncbi:hypothetical protein ACFL54_03010 [Planctomycetota bacterium]
MKEKGIKSMLALASVTGENRTYIQRVMKCLELPEPILDYLKKNTIPAILKYFTTPLFYELASIKDKKQQYRRFQKMLADAKEKAVIWNIAGMEISPNLYMTSGSSHEAIPVSDR